MVIQPTRSAWDAAGCVAARQCAAIRRIMVSALDADAVVTGQLLFIAPLRGKRFDDILARCLFPACSQSLRSLIRWRRSDAKGGK